MFKIVNTLIIALILTWSNFSYAEVNNLKNVTDKVVAVVNSQVITAQDLINRFQLRLRYLKINLTNEQKQELYRKTLGGLINEEIQRQYAEKLNITATSEEVKLAVARVEAANNLPAGSFSKIAQGLERTAIRQIETEILWQKIVHAKIAPKVVISNNEIDVLIENLLSNAIIKERELSQIFIANSDESGKNKSKIKQEAFNLHKKLLAGEDFVTLAKTQSDDDNATKGGYLGWFAPSELSPALEVEVAKLTEVGTITNPIETAAGWHIVRLDNLREVEKFSTEIFTEYRLLILSLDLTGDKKTDNDLKDKFKKRIKKLDKISDLEELINYLKQKEEHYQASRDTGWVKEEHLNAQLMKEVQDIDYKEISDIVKSDKQWQVFAVIGIREQLPKELKEYRQRIRDRLSQNRIELMVRRFMRDLKRKAYLDIRL